MKLISCTIENFGKLNNVTYDFSGECNTICAVSYTHLTLPTTERV